jgi:hypothetical protein
MREMPVGAVVDQVSACSLYGRSDAFYLHGRASGPQWVIGIDKIDDLEAE